jgi:hypothetical protein
MHALIAETDLLSVTGQTDATFSTFYNRAPADAVGLNVISPFFAFRNSCTFDTTAEPDNGTVFVVTDAAAGEGRGEPAVVHRIWAP